MNSWIIEALGWTLLNSLWQIGFIALVLFALFKIFRDFPAKLRYTLSVSALVLSLVFPLVTFVYLSTDSKPVQSAEQTPPTISKSIPVQQINEPKAAETVNVPLAVSAENQSFSPSPKIHLMPILVVFWLVGILFFSVRLLGGIWTIHRYKTRKISPVEAHWQEKFDELCERLGIRRKVRFLQSKKVELPMVVGWLKPVVLVPASVFLQISPDELETILIHELIHIKRHDYLVNFLQNLIEILFFYHPCVWWISVKIRSEREFAVDEFVSQMFEKDRITYVKALANLEEIRSISTTNLAMAANGGNLMRRIENILVGNKKLDSKNISLWSAIFAVIFVLGISVGIYGLTNSVVKNPQKGRKIAVVISNLSGEADKTESIKNLLGLQNKYKIPATWILDSKIIDGIQQNRLPSDFFSQTRKNNSDYIVEVPNITYTTYIDGDEQYLKMWKERVSFVKEYLAKNDYNLKYYSIGYSSQIPQPMEDFLSSLTLKSTKLPFFSLGFQFHFSYEKDCIRVENKLNCKDTNAEKQKQIREKYLKYMDEIFELTSTYYQEKIGKEMPQILSLDTSSLSDVTADELLRSLQDQGYEFVPLEQVTSDETYKSQERSRNEFDLYSKKLEIINKYLDRKLPNLPLSDKEVPKSFNVEVTTKDLKPKPE